MRPPLFNFKPLNTLTQALTGLGTIRLIAACTAMALLGWLSGVLLAPTAVNAQNRTAPNNGAVYYQPRQHRPTYRQPTQTPRQTNRQTYQQPSRQNYAPNNSGFDQPTQNIIIILDASESMNEKLGGMPKIHMAKQTIQQTLSNLPPNVRVGLRVYGHKKAGRRSIFGTLSTKESCRQTELIVPLGANNRSQITNQVNNIQAVGMTPISLAISRSISQDFVGAHGDNHIILVSDGRETCSQNPCDLAVGMARSNVKIQIDAIGLGLHDYVAQDQLKCVAAATKGKFYDAQTAAQLAKGLQQTVTKVNARIISAP